MAVLFKSVISRMPVPTFVRPMEPVPPTEALKVRVLPESLPIEALLPNDIFPCKILLPLIFLKAPVDEIPLPFNVMGSFTVILPWI